MLLVVGLASLGVMFLHPVGPALALVALAPFDGILFVMLGQVGNALTYVPILILLARTPPGLWTQIFLGTRIQLLAFVFMLVLSISHIVSATEFGTTLTLISYARKLTYFLLLGVFSWSLRNSKHVSLIAKVYVLSTALWIVLSAIDFYLGIQLLPVAAGEWGQEGALDVEFEGMYASDLRFLGAGLTVNRTGHYLIVPILLGLGWISSKQRTLQRTLALGCVVVLVVGVMATASRTAAFAVGVGGLVVMATAYRLKLQQVLAIAVVGALLMGAVWFIVSQVGIGSTENIANRFEAHRLFANLGGRINRVLVGFIVWSRSPIIGVGDLQFTRYSRPILESWGDFGGSSAHNAYMDVLAESGLIAFLPFVSMILLSLRRLLVSVRRESAELEYWRPFFLAGLVAQMVSVWFHAYHYERVFWFNLAFASALERIVATSRAQSIRQAAAEPAEGLDGAPLQST
jgi:O-antigen ligase